MIKTVHADDEPKGNGNDADGARNHATQLPISCRRGFGRSHVLSLPLSRMRDQLGLLLLGHLST